MNTQKKNQIIAFGLDAEQSLKVRNALPSENCELFITDCPEDLVARPASGLIVCGKAQDMELIQPLLEYYGEIGCCTHETVFWIGLPVPPGNSRMKFKCFDSFEDFERDLKYHMLSALHKSNQAVSYSKKLAHSIAILAYIHSHPYCKTQQIADTVELPIRAVQRHIATLQGAGEGIEYDTNRKGWYLQYGISELFGDL